MERIGTGDEIGCGRDPTSLLEHSAWVRGLVRALVQDPGQVDDVVQETWKAAIEEPRRSWLDPRAWLGGIARNLARETNRRDARRARREEGSARPEQLPSTDELVEKAELQHRVARAVVELDEPYRSILLLRYFEELSAEEIARRQGRPASTVRSRIKHGLELLRERFDREHGGDRRAWATSLVPLARGRGEPDAARCAPDAASAIPTGAPTMLTKIALGACATLVVGGGTLTLVLQRQASQAGAAATLREAETAAAVQEDASGESGPLAAAESSLAREPVLVQAERDADPARTSAASDGTAPILQGTLLDAASGRPIAAAEIFVGGWRNPFATADGEVALELESGRVQRGGLDEIRALDPDARRREGVMCGCLVLTDPDGTFEARLADAERAWVQAIRTVGVRVEGTGEWHSAPARGIALVAERVPTAELSIRVLDETTAGYLASFDGHLREPAVAPGEPLPPAANFCARADGVAMVRLEIENGPEAYDVELTEPAWAEARDALLVAADTRRELTLTVRSGAGLSGVVTDESGRPVEGALVFWGDLLHMRGYGSPIGAYHVDCAPEPVRSDAGGRFRLPGRAARVSAWHPELSPTSVPASEASVLRLAPRGGLRGRVTDSAGRPLVGREVVLDRARSTTTDAAGAWSFDALEAGLHGISLSGERELVVRVPAGALLDVAPEWIGDVTVEVLAGGAPHREPFGGVVVGSGTTFLVREFRTEEGALGLWDALPGRYHLIDRAGRIARFDVSGSTATVELGDADLTVRAAAGERVYLLPEGDDGALAFWSRRSALEVSPAGIAVFSPLARGRWQVATEARGVVATAVVDGPGAEITLE
jgi:RNA polymerase sigma factor (sigma-70 family)